MADRQNSFQGTGQRTPSRQEKGSRRALKMSGQIQELYGAEREYELTYNIRDGNVTGMRVTHSATLKSELKRKKEQGIKPTYKEGSFKLSELKLNIKDLAYTIARNNSKTQGMAM